MAFLDNSGDIILDAVLTDTGRLRLAQGDGSFKISKFALGDDEINYELYNKSHASGSAYYDLEVLQTPVLEAFTNNTSNLKSKLISLSRTNVLYMPTFKLNRNDETNSANIQDGKSKFFSRTVPTAATYDSGASKTEGDSNKFYIAVDPDTFNAINTYRAESTTALLTEGLTVTGLLQGYRVGSGNNPHQDHIRIDQGLDTTEIAPELGLDSDLLETAYIVETDYRLGRVKPIAMNGDEPTAVNFIDDDNIASYYLTSDHFVNPKGSPGDQEHNGSKDKDTLTNEAKIPMVFSGPRGSTLQLRVQASQELQSSTYLFTQIGNSQLVSAGTFLGLPTADDNLIDNKTIYYIDSTIRVVGANTGFRIDIPVRYVKIK